MNGWLVAGVLAAALIGLPAACIYAAQLVEESAGDAIEAWMTQFDDDDTMGVAEAVDEHADPNVHAAQGCCECEARVADIKVWADELREIDELNAVWALPAADGGRP